MCSNFDVSELKSRFLTSMSDGVNFILSFQFASLSLNNEFMDITYDMMKRKGLSVNYIEDKKNNKAADKLRQQGNKKFEKRRYLEALELYTKSIAKAEIGSESIALAYGNRSAVLLEKKRYEDCLVDIERAFENNYPEKLAGQLKERKEKAEKLKETHKQVPLHEPVPEIPDSEKNPKIECASDCIEIIETPSMGRHLVAKRDLKVGEVVAVEKPFAQVLLHEKERHCHECLLLCYTLIPCGTCSQAMFCSESCRNTAWESYHKYECPILATMNKVGFDKKVYLAIRIAFKSRNDLNKLNQLKNKKTDVYKSDRLEEVYALNTHASKRSLSDVIDHTIEACLIYELIEHHTTFLSDINKMHKFDCERVFKEFLLTLSQIVEINDGRIMELAQDRNQTDLYSDTLLGYDICPLLSLINHGCCPNVLLVRHGNFKTVRIIQSIEKGKPLLNNYCGHYAAVEKISRQITLQQTYFFDCECEPCAKNWPTVMNLPLKNFILHKDLDKVKQPSVKGAKEVLEKWLPHIKEIESERPSYSFFDIQEIIKQCYSIFGNKQITF